MMSLDSMQKPGEKIQGQGVIAEFPGCVIEFLVRSPDAGDSQERPPSLRRESLLLGVAALLPCSADFRGRFYIDQ